MTFRISHPFTVTFKAVEHYVLLKHKPAIGIIAGIYSQI